MLRVTLFGSLFLTFSAVGGIDKGDFLSRCQKEDCLTCDNITISKADGELFKTKEFNISNERCIIFEGGSFSTVNGDFFKQFPETQEITFKFSNISLKSSENLVENPNIAFLELRSCNITDNSHSNALHSMPNLKTLEITENNFVENEIIDQELLSSSVNLETLILKDERSYFWRQSDPSEKVKIVLEKDILTNLVNLQSLQIEIRELSELPPKFLENNQQIKFLEIKGPLEAFPGDLPESLTGLRFQFSQFEKLKRIHLEYLKNLTSLWIRDSHLKEVDVDAFEGTRNLEELNLDFNRFSRLSSKHLANLHLREYSLHSA